MVENAKMDAQVKMGEIQDLLDSDRKIYVLSHFLTTTAIESKSIIIF